MSHHNTCYRSEHYDLWFDNGFLLYGMSLILNSLPASYFRKNMFSSPATIISRYCSTTIIGGIHYLFC
nr:Uncharacterised protein [Klebsiella pneumoniae]